MDMNYSEHAFRRGVRRKGIALVREFSVGIVSTLLNRYQVRECVMYSSTNYTPLGQSFHVAKCSAPSQLFKDRGATSQAPHIHLLPLLLDSLSLS
jgi:hypothetical protein